MNRISFTSVNLVTQENDWAMREWAEAENATNKAFAPLSTFRHKFEELADTAVELGFQYIDLWLAHLNPQWATEEHVAIAKDVLESHQLQPLAFSGGMGQNWQELRAICELADDLGVRALAGPSTAFEADRASAISVLKDAEVVLALENHPLESSPHDMVRKLEGQNVVKTTVDTGWWATVGSDPLEAIRVLAPLITCAHLKDVVGTGRHVNCPWGRGIVPVRECYDLLMDLGYTGPITVEYEPDEGDPRTDIALMKEQLDRWIKERQS